MRSALLPVLIFPCRDCFHWCFCACLSNCRSWHSSVDYINMSIHMYSALKSFDASFKGTYWAPATVRGGMKFFERMGEACLHVDVSRRQLWYHGWRFHGWNCNHRGPGSLRFAVQCLHLLIRGFLVELIVPVVWHLSPTFIHLSLSPIVSCFFGLLVHFARKYWWKKERVDIFDEKKRAVSESRVFIENS